MDRDGHQNQYVIEEWSEDHFIMELKEDFLVKTTCGVMNGTLPYLG